MIEWSKVGVFFMREFFNDSRVKLIGLPKLNYVIMRYIRVAIIMKEEKRGTG
ncbi:hypothetical protein JCM19376_13160 [Fusibacter bizertensis]